MDHINIQIFIEFQNITKKLVKSFSKMFLKVRGALF